MSQGDFVCVSCGSRAAAEGDCPTCQAPYLDLRKPDVVELCHDTERRLRDRRQQRVLWLCVAIAIVVVIGFNMSSIYRQLRREMFALPFLIDQILLMAAIGYGLTIAIERVLPMRRRFPYLPES